MGVELKGIAAAPGFAMGYAKVLTSAVTEVQRLTLAREQVESELARFDAAIAVTAEQLEQIRATTLLNVGETEAEIFETHQMLLTDEEFVGSARNKIRTDRMNADFALDETTREITAIIEAIDDDYLRERAADIRDVSGRLMRQLQGVDDAAAGVDVTAGPHIVVAGDLTPSETAMLDRNTVAGFATEIGGRTSHSAIMARSMDIPAVVGLGKALQQVLPGQFVIVDGTNGAVWIEPDAATRARYDQLREAYATQKELQRRFLAEPSVTLDGHHVELVANIGGPQDAGAAKRQGAEGVGLYRTEFLYMDRTALPSEEEQLAAYRAAAEPFGPDAKIVIRTLDIGGDKKLPYLPLPEEQNPFLGVRAIRLCLNEHELFHTQLRAIVRASAFANLAIMFPMIATLSEWREAKALLVQVMNELEEEGIAFRRDLEVGIMIEIPAAALIADQFAKEVDFFSIGTNDLVQYTMAADRMNEKLAYLTDPFYPAVLRLVHQVIQAANREGKWCGMCGEMAGNLTAIPILLGMGLHEFSMSASAILPARALLSQLKLPEAQQLAAEVLNMSDPEEIKQAVQNKIAHLI